MYKLKRKEEALPGDVYFSGYGKENPEEYFYVVQFEVGKSMLKGKAISILSGEVQDSFEIPPRRTVISR